MTSEQWSRAGKVSQKVQAINRLANADGDPYPVRSGLQMGFIMFDCRTGQWEETTALLFNVGKENRYRWMIDLVKQDKLTGWHDAVRKCATDINRPILRI